MSTQSKWVESAIAELQSTLFAIEDGAVDAVATEVMAARRIVCYGLGRELLSLRAFTMRLVHLDLDANIAGDVTAKPVGTGDLVVVSAGPGALALAETIIDLALAAGARVLVLTAQPGGPASRKAQKVIVIPAQTMADDAGSASILPMGTAYEISLLIFLDLVAVGIREATGQSLDELRGRHFNLE